MIVLMKSGERLVCRGTFASGIKPPRFALTFLQIRFTVRLSTTFALAPSLRNAVRAEGIAVNSFVERTQASFVAVIDQFQTLPCIQKQFSRTTLDRWLSYQGAALSDRAIRVRFCRRRPDSDRLPDE